MNTWVIKLGGSMVSKSEEDFFDFDFIKDFKSVIEELIGLENRFFVTVGGGYLMRKYRDLMQQAGFTGIDRYIHWIGTCCCNLNAETVKACMHDICNERIVAYEDYYAQTPLNFDKPVIVGGGGRAGHSSDVDALQIAKRINAKQVISLKNVDGVYTSDPRTNPDARKLDNLTWEEYLKIINYEKEHKPGANFPVDPIASREAASNGVSYVIMSGANLQNLTNYIKNGDCNGTIIR